MKDFFPLLKNNDIVYLDNAATTQKPNCMIDALSEYYCHFNSNIGRGMYNLSQLSQNCFDESKKTIGNFFTCNPNNIIYTSGSTESINLAAYIAKQHIKKKYILIPISEHHANILIWQKISKDLNLKIFWITKYEDIINPENIDKEILDNTAIITLAHVSNVTGEIYPVKKWCTLAKKINAISVIDGAQAVSCLNVNINDIGCDFYAFSAHKIYGPMGLGVLFISDKYLNSTPLKLGGGIIEDVTLIEHSFIDNSSKFEAGTPNVANAYAFSKTLEFLNNNWDELLEKTHSLSNYLSLQLKDYPIDVVRLYSKLPTSNIISFSVNGIHAHDIGTFLSKYNIAVRVGKHCAYPLHEHLNINSSVRVSLGIYNTQEDIDYFLSKLKLCIFYFNKV